MFLQHNAVYQAQSLPLPLDQPGVSIQGRVPPALLSLLAKLRLIWISLLIGYPAAIRSSSIQWRRARGDHQRPPPYTGPVVGTVSAMRCPRFTCPIPPCHKWFTFHSRGEREMKLDVDLGLSLSLSRAGHILFVAHATHQLEAKTAAGAWAVSGTWGLTGAL
jgi:hypothetical protein